MECWGVRKVEAKLKDSLVEAVIINMSEGKIIETAIYYAMVRKKIKNGREMGSKQVLNRYFEHNFFYWENHSIAFF